MGGQKLGADEGLKVKNGTVVKTAIHMGRQGNTVKLTKTDIRRRVQGAAQEKISGHGKERGDRAGVANRAGNGQSRVTGHHSYGRYGSPKAIKSLKCPS